MMILTMNNNNGAKVRKTFYGNMFLELKRNIFRKNDVMYGN